MPHVDPRHWSPCFDFDPAAGTVIRRPPGEGPGYWAGAPGATFDAGTGRFYLSYRLRRPRGVHPDRGSEVHVAVSHDGIEFEDVWVGYKEELNTTSIERSALVRCRRRWRLYTSFVDPADHCWMIGLVEADRPENFDLKSLQPVLKAGDLGVEGVKDPFIFQTAGLWQMIVSYAIKDAEATAEQLHGTDDAYNTGLILSVSGLATSRDGVDWQWEGQIFVTSKAAWDKYAARIGTLWYQDPLWLAFYDGSADVSENYEERCGLAFSHDLRTFHRVSRTGPLWNTPHGTGAIRYFDVLRLPEATYVYYEMARPNGSHDLWVYRMA